MGGGFDPDQVVREDVSDVPRVRAAAVRKEPTAAEVEKKKRLQMDMLTIVTALVLQDLPFFFLRMTLIFKYLSFCLFY